MKVSAVILLATLILLLLVTGLFVFDVSLKKKYKKVDKGDLFASSETITVFAKYGF